ncbi:hypothetical protein ACQ4PT_044636 [Festuca glaucescens]
MPGSGCASGGLHTPSPAPYPVVEMDDDFEGSPRRDNPAFLHRRSFQSGLSRSLRMEGDILTPGQSKLERRYSVNDRVMYGSRASDYEANYHRYCLVASKQMVGLFLMVWARREIKSDIRNLKVSCVGRGLMGYLGNKPLDIGQKDGDEQRRNSDVMEILRKTRFPMVYGQYERSPETILEHDRIIWLGDLNYWISLSYRTVKALVEMRNWKALLEKDQVAGIVNKKPQKGLCLLEYAVQSRPKFMFPVYEQFSLFLNPSWNHFLPLLHSATIHSGCNL